MPALKMNEGDTLPEEFNNALIMIVNRVVGAPLVTWVNEKAFEHVRARWESTVCGMVLKVESRMECDPLDLDDRGVAKEVQVYDLHGPGWGWRFVVGKDKEPHVTLFDVDREQFEADVIVLKVALA